jgi:hypothetical protein
MRKSTTGSAPLSTALPLETVGEKTLEMNLKSKY